MRIIPRLDSNQRILIISDMHIGDGSKMEGFQNKDELLLDFLRFAEHHSDTVIIAGDGFDVCQAWSLKRIYRAHRYLMDAMHRLAQQMPVYYIQGNHNDMPRELVVYFPFEYHPALWIGDKIYIEHGHQYDPYCQPGNTKSDRMVKIHALFERLAGAPLRIPMRKYYGWSTRIGHWLFYRYGQWQWLRAQLFLRWGQPDRAQVCFDFLDYFGRGEWGELNINLQAVHEVLMAAPYEVLICGHSHQAGKVRFPGGLYINSGSWTFDEATFVDLDHGTIEVKSWPSLQCIGDEEYRGILGPHHNKSFFEWWEAFYLGWFCYDVEAMHRAVGGEPLPGDGETEMPEWFAEPHNPWAQEENQNCADGVSDVDLGLSKKW